jgi:hypothetical protein
LRIRLCVIAGNRLPLLLREAEGNQPVEQSRIRVLGGPLQKIEPAVEEVVAQLGREVWLEILFGTLEGIVQRPRHSPPDEMVALSDLRIPSFRKGRT